MKSLLAVSTTLAALSIRSCVGVSTTSVAVQNNTAFPLEVSVLYSDDQNTLESVLEANGTELTYVLQPGESQLFSRECDRLQAVRVSGDLQVLGGLGPSKTSKVFRDGSDFNCGSALTFTFTAPGIPTTLDLSTDIQD